MSDFLHRTTKRLSFSGNDPEHSIVDWLKLASRANADDPFSSPTLSAVTGQPSKYWIITGDVVSLMDQAARDAVDAAEAAALLAATQAAAQAAATDGTDLGFRVRALIELFNKRDNFLTTRIIELQDALGAMKASSGGAQNTRDAIPASFLGTNTRARPAAIADYDSIIGGGEVDS